jgi:uncharacterized protein YbgA (DUF1722 family)
MEREELLELINKFRRHASDLRASAWTIKWYWLWFRFGFIPEKNKLLEASGDLIAYSNSIRATHHEDWEHIKRRQESIKSLLGFE